MKIIKRIKQKIYSFISFRGIEGKGEKCKVNSFCHFTKNTFLGENCNFNGCRIIGNGKVTIGNKFHSGSGLRMITSFHNYDGGVEIPYDSTNIDKDIVIGVQAWIGTDVLALGGDYRRRHNYTSWRRCCF